MTYAGIDPGLGGAIAFVQVLDTNQIVAEVFDVPVAQVKIGKSFRQQYAVMGMVEIAKRYLSSTTRFVAVLERVHSMPGQGVSSSFAFGRGLGLWEGVMAGLQIPYTLVSPQRWKKSMMADRGKEKDAARLCAMEVFPALYSQLQRKRDHGRAEALLLAEYGRRLGL